MTPRWNPIELSGEAAQADEQMGSKEKFWISIQGDERPWLVKIARTDERDGTVSGEDWAEWVVHQLANLIGIPTASIRPATVDGERASMSRSVLHDASDALVHGNSLLSARFPNYDLSVVGENPGYTPSAVQDALKGVAPPAEQLWPRWFTAYDAWVGYLVIDAWVAGRDRHHENWGVVTRAGARRLAPSFDHGNALGFQERDPKRLRLLGDDAFFKRWAERGTSRHFAGQHTLVQLACMALHLAPTEVQAYWLEKFTQIDDDAIHSVTSEVPDAIMSEVAGTFVVRLLAMNRRRLLDGYAST